jgi:hypothetical protein
LKHLAARRSSPRFLYLDSTAPESRWIVLVLEEQLPAFQSASRGSRQIRLTLTVANPAIPPPTIKILNVSNLPCVTNITNQWLRSNWCRITCHLNPTGSSQQDYYRALFVVWCSQLQTSFAERWGREAVSSSMIIAFCHNLSTFKPG